MDLAAQGQNHSFMYKGPRSGSLLPAPAINGVTHVLTQGGEMDRAFIFLPIDPQTDKTGGRPIGTGLKIAIALHEVLHACGLDDTDPGHQTQLNDPDLFRTGADGDFNFPPDGVPGDPKKPGDRLALGFKKFTPPFFLSGCSGTTKPAPLRMVCRRPMTRLILPGAASRISIRPLPTWLLPDHS